MKRIIFTLFVFFLLATVVNAAFYKCINKDGSISVTDRRIENAKCELLEGQDEKSMPEGEYPLVKINAKQQKNKLKKQHPLTIEQFPVFITIRKPDKEGTVYMDATYLNNSNRKIVGFIAKVLLKDTKERQYLCSHDTVLPGQTSPTFNTFGPKTLRQSDIEILKYDITIENKDGSETHLEYDNKLKSFLCTDRNCYKIITGMQQDAMISTSKSELVESTYAKEILPAQSKDISIRIEECAEYARAMVDVNNKSVWKAYADKIKAICPGMGFECKTFYSHSEKNKCEPFKLDSERTFFKDSKYGFPQDK